MLRNCLEEDLCLYRPNAWGEGEFKWLKTPKTTAAVLQKIVFLGQKTLKKLSNSTYITTCGLEGFKEKFSSLIQKQTSAYSVIRHDWRGSGEILDEGMVSCQVFSNLIRHYRRKFRAVKLANGGFKKY